MPSSLLPRRLDADLEHSGDSKHMLDESNLHLMYTMFIRPILEYGSLVYMGAAQSHLDKLDRVQDSAMKMCDLRFSP